MSPDPYQPTHSWIDKFRYAFRGLGVGFSQQNSFLIHVPIALAVLVAGIMLRVTHVELSVLVLCIVVVFSAEMLNSALEHMAKALTRQRREELRDALDTSAAAVLVAALGSVVIGAIIFVPHLVAFLPMP